jgi:hypothetical protein
MEDRMIPIPIILVTQNESNQIFFAIPNKVSSYFLIAPTHFHQCRRQITNLWRLYNVDHFSFSTIGPGILVLAHQ